MATPQDTSQPQGSQAPQIDLSDSLVPKSSVAGSQGIDLSDSLVPKESSQTQPWVRVSLSTGHLVEAHPDDLGELQRRDPGAKVQPIDPNLPTMSAATPSVWERVKNAITKGIPAFNSDFELASHTDTGRLSSGETPQMQLVTPQAAMTATEQEAHPILTGVAETAGGLTSAPSALMIAGTAGFGELGAAGKAILPRLVSAGFSVQALKGAYDQVPAFKKALDSGDTAEAERILTHIVLDVGMGGIAARHAVTGGPAISDTASNVASAGKATGAGIARAAETIKEAPGRAKDIATEWLTKRPETPAAQHGTPVRVESPLDGPTVGRQLGGKDLSQEALNTLQGHVGDKIPVGSTAKNVLMKSVEPVSRKISETASKMNDVVQKAPQFTTSVMQDNVFGEGTFTGEIEAIKKNLPASVRDSLSQDVDSVVADADKALNSNDPAEVLEQRRLLGKRIDWDKVEKNPSTPAEVQNLARVKVYKALGDKIHSEIPETVPLDKVMQPNLELRSHTATKLGQRVIEDPHAATVEAQSEFKKGQTTVENAAHNEKVAKNWQKVKIAAGIAGVTGLEKLWKLFEGATP